MATIRRGWALRQGVPQTQNVGKVRIHLWLRLLSSTDVFTFLVIFLITLENDVTKNFVNLCF